MKILFTDLDGTLLRDDKSISAVLVKAAYDFCNLGNKLVLCSGRPLLSILAVKNSFLPDCNNCYASSYNGALVYDIQAQKNLFEARVPLSYVTLILDEAEKRGIHCHTYSDTHVISRHKTTELIHYLSYISMPCSIGVDAISSLTSDPFKLIAIKHNARKELEAFRDYINQITNGVITSVLSSDFNLEFFYYKAGKENSLLFLSDFFSVPIQNTIAVGDAGNDIAMIKVAGLGVAVKNAEDSVKAAASYITEYDNNQDGILELFKR